MFIGFFSKFYSKFYENLTFNKTFFLIKSDQTFYKEENFTMNSIIKKFNKKK